jgi:putative membrane protein
VKILLRIVLNAVALGTTTVVPGITFHGDWLRLLLCGILLGLFNLTVRPIAVFLSFPLLLLSLGLFSFVLNALLLWLAQFILPGYKVAGFVPALLGALVLGLVNWALNTLFGTKKKAKKDDD